uniref:Lipid phosphate phosphohydrolase 1 n=1 Tax=Schistocephalus solidus TaxID=70667 RepID=A0A0X3PU64_SCHSO
MYSPRCPSPHLRVSFPSGHSACGAFGAWFTSFYLQRQRIPHSLHMLRSLAQITLVAVGVYICLTRISDYWHRAADVIVGYLLGALCSIAIFYTPAGRSLVIHGDSRGEEL